MSKLSTWISAMRLRTLPLAFSSILLGAMLADLHGAVKWKISLLCMLTASLLQILSNFANDYGDYIKGTDNANRLGNTRALQSGNISVTHMKIAIGITLLLAFFSGVYLLLLSTSGSLNLLFVVFLLLGIACILAAIKYTVGSNAYGYRGLGDIAVFCFFGWVGVIGTFLLNDVAEEFFIPPTIFIPASGIGLLCTAVLNTNNIRDIKNDADSGKMTIPVKIGLKKARLYHSFLVFGGLGCLLFYSFYFYYHPVLFVQLPASCLIVYAATQVLYTEPGVKYNSLLKSLSLGILLFTVTYVFSLSFASIANATQELIP